MTDKLTKSQRSLNMSQIKGKNTKPEMQVRSVLHSLGYRYRLHKKDLPGKPDIVLTKYKTIIFVNGCFWHGHSGCKRSNIPKSNVEYWSKKIAGNISRFQDSANKLQNLGWKVFVIWECETKDPILLEQIIKNCFE